MISTGFVVDDAIVVIENITRYLERGVKPLAAALRGAEEIGFTVISMSVSLVAVFIPLLMMGGIVGRLFREFAVTPRAAITVSMFVSPQHDPDDVRLHAEAAHNPWPGIPCERAGLQLRRVDSLRMVVDPR